MNTHFHLFIIISLSWSTNPSKHNFIYFSRRRYQLRQMGLCIEMGATRWAQRFRTSFFESRYGTSKHQHEVQIWKDWAQPNCSNHEQLTRLDRRWGSTRYVQCLLWALILESAQNYLKNLTKKMVILTTGCKNASGIM